MIPEQMMIHHRIMGGHNVWLNLPKPSELFDLLFGDPDLLDILCSNYMQSVCLCVCVHVCASVKSTNNMFSRHIRKILCKYPLLVTELWCVWEWGSEDCETFW